MRNVALFICLIFTIPSGFTQSPYDLTWKTEGILLRTSGALLVGDYILGKIVQDVTQQEVEKLQVSNIPVFDRLATSLHSDAARLRSDIGVVGTGALSSISSLLISIRESQKSAFSHQLFTLGVMLLETNAINYGGTSLVKCTSQRIRPMAYKENFVIDNLAEGDIKDLKKSFFSRHASIAAANTYFLAGVFADYYPESRWKTLIWSAAVIIPAWTGFERVLAGEHFPSDVVSGYLFGAACGILVPKLHKKKSDEYVVKVRVLPHYSDRANGMTLMLTF